MAVITTYTSLTTAVQDYLVRSDLSTFAPNFVQSWEEDFLRDSRNWGRWMESALNGTIASQVLAVPTGYLGLKYAYVDDSITSKLDRVSLNQLYGTYPRGSTPGLPRWLARDVENFVFGPVPDEDYAIKGVYWRKPTVLRSFAADAAAHYLIVNAPDLCLYGSLCAAEPFIKNDARLAVWQAMYDRNISSYRALMRDEDVSGSPIQEILA